MKVKTQQLDIKEDSRGWLAEILRTEQVDGQPFGQLLITVAKPGQTKGNHYHLRKREWFCVIEGKGLLTIRDRETGEVWEKEIGKENLLLVEIPHNAVHYIKNIGLSDMYLLAYLNEAFNSQDTDTFYE